MKEMGNMWKHSEIYGTNGKYMEKHVKYMEQLGNIWKKHGKD